MPDFFKEPSAIYKNCKNPFFTVLTAPSAVFTGTATAALALHIYGTIRNFFSEGNAIVSLYATFTMAGLNFPAPEFLRGFIVFIFYKVGMADPLLTVHR